MRGFFFFGCCTKNWEEMQQVTRCIGVAGSAWERLEPVAGGGYSHG